MTDITFEQLKNNTKTTYNLHKLSQYTLLATAFFLPISTSLTNILFYLTAILILITCKWSYIVNTIKKNHIALTFIGFWLLFTIGITYSEASNIDTFMRWKKQAKFILAPLFFCLFTNRKLAIMAVKLFIISILITCCLGYLKAFHIISINDRLAGTTSIFKSHIQTGILLAYTGFISLVLAKYESKYKWFYITFFILVTINNLFLGTGRTGYVIFFILTILFLFRCLPLKWTIPLLLLILTIPPVLYQTSSTFNNRIDLIKTDLKKFQNNNADSSVGLRLSFLLNGIKIIQKNPLYGSGTGSVEHKYKQIEKNPIYLTDNPHNEYLNVGIQTGIIGLIFLLSMLAYHWFKAIRLTTPYNLLAEGLVITIIFGSIANSLLMDTTESHFYVYFIAAYFGTLSVRRQ